MSQQADSCLSHLGTTVLGGVRAPCRWHASKTKVLTNTVDTVLIRLAQHRRAPGYFEETSKSIPAAARIVGVLHAE